MSRASSNDSDMGLTKGEYKIVHLLVSNVGRYVTYRAIYDRLHYEGFIAGSGDDGYRGTSVRQSSASATSSATSIRTLPKSRTTQPADTAGASRLARAEQPQYSFRPWAHSSMDCLMQQHPSQKLLDFSIGIRLGKQSSEFRCFTK
jgi:hypothetical protein